MRDEIDQKYNDLILGLDTNVPTYEVRKGWYQAIKKEDLGSIQSLQARLKKKGKMKIFRYRC